jgi:hypothetical protein
MSFGQQSGPPASPKQIAYLKSLLRAAGHDDFRSARHSYGLTQRQAGGKFTSREASQLIDRLTGVEPEPARDEGPAGDPDATSSQVSGPDPLDSTRRDLLRGMPAELLADELARRGWTTMPPAEGGH